jgi:hypothetical protein
MGPQRCQLCLEAHAHVRDPHVGPVCAMCYTWLVFARHFLEEVGERLGIKGCAEPRRPA